METQKNKRKTLSWIWHHIAESNWINFIGYTILAFYISHLLVANSAKDALIEQQRVQIELDREATNILVADIYSRLENVKSSKIIAEETWTGIRRTKY